MKYLALYLAIRMNGGNPLYAMLPPERPVSLLSPAEKSGLRALQNAVLQDSSKISSSGYILRFLIFIAISSQRI